MSISFYKSHYDSLINILNKQNLINNIQRDSQFYDEPKIFSIGTQLQGTKHYSDGIPVDIKGFGYSFTSPHIALFKSLFESVERFSNGTYKEKDLIYDTYSNLQPYAINPHIYTDENLSIEKKIIGWTKGENIIKGVKTYIPAQDVFHNYKRKKTEPYLCDTISTGAAAGIDKTSTILRGIYEVIERDVFITMYLNKISSSKVVLEKLGWKELDKILTEFKRYNLELHVIDITNDLAIPTYLSILLDYSGIGPTITLGLKSSLSRKTAILGSIEESCLVRPWLRYQLRKSINRTRTLNPQKIQSLLERALYWSHPHMLSYLDFFLKPENFIQEVKDENINPGEELKIVKKMFKEKNIDIYTVDITPSFLDSSPYQVHKVSIPQLQPLYLHEAHKILKPQRLKTVANYFNIKHATINPIPHPFL